MKLSGSWSALAQLHSRGKRPARYELASDERFRLRFERARSRSRPRRTKPRCRMGPRTRSCPGRLAGAVRPGRPVASTLAVLPPACVNAPGHGVMPRTWSCTALRRLRPVDAPVVLFRAEARAWPGRGLAALAASAPRNDARHVFAHDARRRARRGAPPARPRFRSLRWGARARRTPDPCRAPRPSASG